MHFDDPMMHGMMPEMAEMPMFWPFPDMAAVPEFEDIHYQ